MLKQLCVWANFQPFKWDKMRMQTQKSVQDLEQYPCPMLVPVCPKQPRNSAPKLPSLGSRESLEHYIVNHQFTTNHHLSALRECLISYITGTQKFREQIQHVLGSPSGSVTLLRNREQSLVPFGVWANNFLTALRATHQHPTLKVNVFWVSDRVLSDYVVSYN